ncbi:MAG: hypothetical protein R3E86_05500 [Pseudomonadales bacterium]
MTTGVEIRAQIDTDVMRALLLVNGGAAVALIALLPYVLDRADLIPLAKAILLALVGYQVALVSVVVSGRLRRVCSLEYERANSTSPQGLLDSCTIFGWDLKEPCSCIWSKVLMWASLALFLASGSAVAIGGYMALSQNAPAEISSDA